LGAEELETLQAWIRAGGPEGAPVPGQLAPEYEEGWQLGPPYLVAQMPSAFVVPAEGRDVYRNFVIPAPADRTRFIRAVEWSPDNRPVLHHALLFVDDSGEARANERRDPEPGYATMGFGGARLPDGLFVAWTPGRQPSPGTPDIAWRLDPGTDLVLQLHLRPRGRKEPIRVALGLYFADGPPTRRPMAIRLYSRDIDIPAGEGAWPLEADYTLPVPVELLEVYPHAHYLGKEMTALAELPGGERQTLLHIPRWDFN